MTNGKHTHTHTHTQRERERERDVPFDAFYDMPAVIR